jgi:hypothetical protein
VPLTVSSLTVTDVTHGGVFKIHFELLRVEKQQGKCMDGFVSL